MNSIFDNYTNRASVSKTLQFKLIPTEHTKRHVAEHGILQSDGARASAYAKVKNILDEYHKKYLAEKLSEFTLDFGELYDAYCARKKDEQSAKNYDAVQKKYRKRVSDYLKNGADLSPKKIIAELLKEQPQNEYLKQFDKFSTYFENYRIIRENLYAADGASSVSYRLINENFPRFARNVSLFKKLDSGFVSRMENGLHADGILPDEICLAGTFDIAYFSRTLTQEGIDFYNTLLGGIADGETKRRGVNEYCNLAYQQGEIEKFRFDILYKQILSDRATLSFIPQAFENDAQVKSAVKEYFDGLTGYDFWEADKIFDDENSGEGIFVGRNQLSELSRVLFENEWSKIDGCLHRYAETLSKKDADKFLKKSEYTLRELYDCTGRNDILFTVEDTIKNIVARLQADYAEVLPQLCDMRKIENYDGIKAILDDASDIERLFRFFVAGKDADRDCEFYDAFDDIYSRLRESIKLYNKVRNYATKKATVPEKMKLNFNSSTLADGWDKNKENDNLAVIFIKDGKYYLGIKNKACKPSFNECKDESVPCYRKMEYKQIASVSKDLPKNTIGQFRKKSGKFLPSKYNPSEYILNGYAANKHKKGEAFDIDFCHDLIDFFKDAINKNPDYKVFDFKFSPTTSYADLSDFYKEVDAQAYRVNFVPVAANDIDALDRDGKLYLFEIYNKDLSAHSTGKKNLHTLYWQELFSDRNLKDGNVKLCGGAELFYRPADTGNAFVHKKGDILIRKTNDDGTPVDNVSYEAAMTDARTGDMELCKRKYPSLQFRYAPHDITKNKRYYEEQYSFHVPITLNSKASGMNKFNEEVLKTVSGSQCNIIGVDRGERNLLYVSVIDRNGNILHQQSLNEINGIDYNAKLKAIAAERDCQRKNWRAIQQIKDVKAGYLSAAVHEIAELMLKYNAILVMENLNMGFKRSRISIENQIYQNFEKSFIEKLHYLADKNKAPYEPGGIANAYQLTAPFKSFKKLSYQTGFVFYVNAAYTSKIDPRTGFVNLLSRVFPRDISMKNARENLSKFKSIVYNKDEDRFEFTFDYADFGIKAGSVDEWTVGTCGSGRIDGYTENGRFKNRVVEVTAEMKELFEKYGVDYAEGDLRESVCAVSEKSFYDRLLYLLRVTVKLRYEDKDNDFILSPIVNYGKPFDSREHNAGLPVDGDANGAYHIALQGLRMLGNINNGKLCSDEKGEANNNWFDFAQEIARKKQVK